MRGGPGSAKGAQDLGGARGPTEQGTAGGGVGAAPGEGLWRRSGERRGGHKRGRETRSGGLTIEGPHTGGQRGQARSREAGQSGAEGGTTGGAGVGAAQRERTWFHLRDFWHVEAVRRTRRGAAAPPSGRGGSLARGGTGARGTGPGNTVLQCDGIWEVQAGGGDLAGGPTRGGGSHGQAKGLLGEEAEGRKGRKNNRCHWTLAGGHRSPPPPPRCLPVPISRQWPSLGGWGAEPGLREVAEEALETPRRPAAAEWRASRHS